MTKPQNTEAIEKATQRSWSEWVAWIDERGGRDLKHPEIVKKVYPELEDITDKPGWWAQGVTVAYEQHIGRRVAGQRGDGTFEVSISKTLDVAREEAFAQCLELLSGVTELNGRVIDNVRTSETPVRSYWRCSLSDGSKLTFSVEQKSPGRTLLVVAHASLRDADEAAAWREFWKEYIKEIK